MNVGRMTPSFHCRWKYRLEQPLWKSAWHVLGELQINLPYVAKGADMGAGKGFEVTEKHSTGQRAEQITEKHKGQAVNK